VARVPHCAGKRASDAAHRTGCCTGCLCHAPLLVPETEPVSQSWRYSRPVAWSADDGHPDAFLEALRKPPKSFA
jgi:hypothetical protein